MFGLFLVAAVGAYVIYQKQSINEVVADLPLKLSEKLDKLWQIAQEALSERKYLRAEKALLMILRVDERNATAYNRLGILYAKQQAYKDAIECFEIAQSLEPSASSLHNVGLIYYETEKYEKAALAFEQALAMEEDLASRHIAYAKVQEKLGNDRLMFMELEKAAELEPNKETYTLLHKAFVSRGMEAEADIIEDKLSKMIVPSGQPKRIVRPKRVVV